MNAKLERRIRAILQDAMRCEDRYEHAIALHRIDAALAAFTGKSAVCKTPLAEDEPTRAARAEEYERAEAAQADPK